MDDPRKREELLSTYLAIAASEKARGADDESFWAVEAMWDVVARDPEGAWSILLELIGRADGDYALAYIAAGPLENFLVAYGEAFLPRVEAEAGRNAKFRRALVGVWGESRMSENLVRRLHALVEGEPPL
jgi:hypothetical protein